VEWRDVLSISQAVTTGMTEEQAKATLRNDRPMLVYVYDDDTKDEDEDQRFFIEEAKNFRDDSVAVAARFFDCVRIDLESAKEDRAMRKKVRRGKTLVFVHPDYTVYKVLSAKASAKKIFSVMNALVKRDYDNCPHCVFGEQMKLVKEWVRVDVGYAKIAELTEGAKDEANRKKRAKLIRRRDEMQKDIATLEMKLGKRESELYELQPKAKKKAS